MSGTRRLGLLGGTFDPVHVGHFDAGDAARTALALDEILLIPTHDQPLRPNAPGATNFQRFALLSLAVADKPAYRLSEMEISRSGPSYTSETLQALHAEGWKASQLFFILGTDAFATITAWHGFPSFLDLAHFVVIARPGASIETAIARAPRLRPRMDTAADAAPIDDGQTRVLLVEAKTRDVSSTMVRERLVASQPIDDLVPVLVARHILRHHLYGAVDDLHDENERI